MRINNIILVFAVIFINCVKAQNGSYLHVHGTKVGTTVDSIFFTCSTNLIDSISFEGASTSVPTIISISKTMAATGSNIVISGFNFPTTKSSCRVLFGDVAGTVVSTNLTTINVTIPSIAFDKIKTTIQVRNDLNGTGSNQIKFTICDPAKCYFDSFDRVNTNWDNVGINPSLIGANWATIQGQYQINTNFLNSALNGQVIYKNPAAAIYPGKKFYLEADLKVDHPTDGASFAGIVFNYQNDGQTYQLVRISGSGLVQALTTYDNGANWQVNLSNSYALPGQNYYHFEIYADGSTTYNLKISKMDGTVVVNTPFTSSLAVTGYKTGFFSLGGLSMYDNFSIILENTTPDYIPLFGDNFYSRGFNVRSTSSINHNIIGQLNYGGSTFGTPVWSLAQWNCVNNDMTSATYTNVNGIKKYKVGTNGNEISVNSNGTFSMVLNSTTEFGLSTTNPHNPRQSGDPWPNFLIETSSNNAQMFKISSATEIRMNIDYTVTKMENYTPNYNPSMHAGQFLWYITVQNRNTSSPDYGKYVWFGLALHDNRYPYSPLYASPDMGPNNTGMFIYCPDMQPIMQSQGPIQVGKNFIVDVNVLPMLQTAFTTAQANHYLSNTTWNDLYIGGMNIGFETPGTFNVGVDIKSFNVKYK